MSDHSTQDLVSDNINLVYYIISHEYPTYLYDEDIVQSGMLGLCKAAERWDSERGAFGTYAGQWIRGEIRQEFTRRKKHKGELSLEYEYDDDLTLGDTIVGEADVDYLDHSFFGNLPHEEQKVFELYNKGFSPDEIADICAYNVQKVRKILRTIRIKWKNGN